MYMYTVYVVDLVQNQWTADKYYASTTACMCDYLSSSEIELKFNALTK